MVVSLAVITIYIIYPVNDERVRPLSDKDRGLF